MQNSVTLPDGYHELCRLGAQEKKASSILLALGTVLFAAAMIVIASFSIPLTEFFDPFVGWTLYFARIATLLAGVALYCLVHELLHGLLMRRFSGIKSVYRFNGLYSAGSNAYFTRGSYLIILFAPIVLFGVLLTVGCCFVPRSWFWVVYLVQVFNLANAVNDVWLAVKLLRLPSDILIQLTESCLRVYSRITI